MLVKNITVKNRLGVHARPAALLTKTANLFECAIRIKKGTKCADAKSILAVMTLGAKYNDSLRLEFEGTNEIAACDAIVALFESRFGEEE
jgi:phosphocarrier protein HPr